MNKFDENVFEDTVSCPECKGESVLRNVTSSEEPEDGGYSLFEVAHYVCNECDCKFKITRKTTITVGQPEIEKSGVDEVILKLPFVKDNITDEQVIKRQKQISDEFPRFKEICKKYNVEARFDNMEPERDDPTEVVLIGKPDDILNVLDDNDDNIISRFIYAFYNFGSYINSNSLLYDVPAELEGFKEIPWDGDDQGTITVSRKTD